MKNLSWGSSDLRAWLNDEFYKNAFSGAERYMILSSKTEYNCNDYIFVLSSDEVVDYLDSNSPLRIGNVTPKIKQYVAGNVYSWWLRNSSGSTAASVTTSGGIVYRTNSVAGVRPAMWIDIDLEN